MVNRLFFTHSKCLAKLVAHQVVEQRIDAGGQIVEHAGHICHHRVEELMLIVPLGAAGGRVNGNQPLCMEGGPAQKEADDNGNWCEIGKQTKNRQIIVTLSRSVIYFWGSVERGGRRGLEVTGHNKTRARFINVRACQMTRRDKLASEWLIKRAPPHSTHLPPPADAPPPWLTG